MTGLRERKRAATRQSISDIATSMFMARGFDETTIVDIARDAGVSPQTVANYFPNKADLFFDDASWLTGPPSAIREHCPALDPRAAVARGYVEHLGQRRLEQFAGLHRFRRTIRDSPALRHRYLDDLTSLAGAMTDALIETSPAMPQRTARLLASQIAVALDVCEDEIAMLATDSDIKDVLAAASRVANEILQARP